jgi:hypothetical protein
MGISQIIPSNYEFAGKWQLKWKGWPLFWLVIGMFIVFGLTLVLAFTVIIFLQIILLQTELVGEWIPYHGLLLYVIFLVVFGALVVVHEAIHGVMFLGFGCKPRFGVKLIGKYFPVVVYTTSRLAISRNKYIIVSLAPFLVITLVFLVIGIITNNKGVVILAIFVVAMNVSGSIVDIIMAWKIWKHGRWTIFEDTEDGFNWYVPSESKRDEY